jgi:Zn-dependent peptidase ImmA (M78 family)
LSLIEINIDRIKYLLKLYNLTEEELLLSISKNLKKLTPYEDVFSEKIKLSNLKKIDNVFKKGLSYYLDPKPPVSTKEASIFFRKSSFNSDLNVGARKIVNQFEDEKISLTSISQLASIKYERVLPKFTVNNNPKEAAEKIREIVYPAFNQNLKEFLKAFIAKLGDNNIYVFEFVEVWNKKDIANIDGFYLSPNFIVLKRQQKYFRREIFTLAHELGHYLLDEEEIEELDLQKVPSYPMSSIERWCHDFAYYFLINNYDADIDKIKIANSSNNYLIDLLEDIRNHTHLSKRALYTRLLLLNKLSAKDYKYLKEKEEAEYYGKELKLKNEKLLMKEAGVKPKSWAPKPIISPLLVRTVRVAYLEGVINETEFCQRLNIKPRKMEKYFQ